jgi:cation diffusion facilitator CzcD-associated flavoprotein CzcO
MVVLGGDLDRRRRSRRRSCRDAVRCNLLMMCSGYYRYDRGYTPAFAGLQDFARHG